MVKKTESQLRASRNYNAKNKELINKKSLEYSKKEPDKNKANKARYRAKIRAQKQNGKTINKNKKEVKKMFGKRKEVTEEVEAVGPAIEPSPDLVVENAGMPGFTKDPEPVAAPVAKVKKVKAAPVPVAAPVPAPVAEPVAEQYQIIETSMSPGEGLYVYKIVTNKYLGELGGVYEA